MHNISLSKQLIACLILFNFLVPVSAAGFTQTDDYFEVFPNKEYTGKVCIEATPTATVTMTNNSGMIKSFSVSENFKSMGFREFRCGTYTFEVNEFKTTQESVITEKIYISTPFGAPGGSSFSVGLPITINASEVSYVNLLFKLSGKLVITFISIFAVLAALLYMIRKIRKE